MKIAKVGIIGAGQMGAGIAQVCATAGYEVLINDTSPERIKAGLEPAGGMLASGAARRSVGSESEEQRLSTNMTIERQTPKRDFGD